MGPGEPITVHDNCDSKKRVALQNDLEKYKTRHLTSGCSCEELLVDARGLDEILMSGSLPLLDITEGQDLSDLSISIRPSTSSIPWVALSHVWADGLGNPVDNALPRCQLQHLKKLARAVTSNSNGDRDPRESLLWIDTLCCPVAPEDAKRRALTEMRRTYQQATYVLVIESTLQACMSETMALEEIWARIMLSGWMRRLWTLQEGALPARDRRLWFQFRDRAISFRSLWQALRKMLDSGFRQMGLAIDFHSRMQTFTAWSTQSSRPDLAVIDDALQFRSVSVRSDEPILLGNLLDLDVRKILDGSEDTRIYRMWSLMPSALHGIPKGILFRLGPRLKEEGFRWAPATMIDSEKSNKMLAIKLGGYNEGKPTRRGLLVDLAGFTLSMAGRPRGLPPNTWNILAPQQIQSLYMRDEEGSWYLIVRRMPTAEGDFLSSSRLEDLVRSNSDLWVAHAETDFQLRADGERQISTAILVKLVEDEFDVKYVRAEMHVNVLLVPHSLQGLMAAAYQCAHELSDGPIVAQLRSVSNEDVEMRNLTYRSFYDAIEPEIHRVASANQAQGTSSWDHTQHSPKLLEYMIAMMFIGQYAVMGTRLPGTTQWCVD